MNSNSSAVRASKFGFFESARQSFLRRPYSVVGLVLLCGLAVGLVGTKSLPFALATSNPDLAPKFASEHPAVLLARAEKLRGRLVQLVAAELAEGKQSDAAGSKSTSAGRFATPDIAVPQEAGEVDRDALRAEIRKLSAQVIEADPLSSRAYRLLAEASGEQGAVRAGMEAAFQRSRRESTAAFWLLNDSFQKRETAAVLKYSDIILRTKVQLTPLVMSYLGQLAAASATRAELVQTLATNPSWRARFFHHLPKSVPDPKAPLKLLLDLKETPHPMLDAELRPYLDMLMGNGRVELAYSAWLQHLPAEKLQKLRRITNESFDDAVSGLPFNWVLTNPRYAAIEAHPTAGNPGNRALHLNLGPGRIKFGEVRQVLMLPPGSYEFSGSLKGKLKGRRGLRWQLRCGKQLRDVLGQSELLIGAGPKWTPFSIKFVVPNEKTCRSQTLRLFHHARSASEELIFGELWFDDLRLQEKKAVAGG